MSSLENFRYHPGERKVKISVTCLAVKNWEYQTTKSEDISLPSATEMWGYQVAKNEYIQWFKRWQFIYTGIRTVSKMSDISRVKM